MYTPHHSKIYNLTFFSRCKEKYPHVEPLIYSLALDYQSALALDYMNDGVKLSHCDVKPANRLLTPGSIVGGRLSDRASTLLTDLGYAHAASNKRYTGALVPGTAGYIAPELIDAYQAADGGGKY